MFCDVVVLSHFVISFWAERWNNLFSWFGGEIIKLCAKEPRLKLMHQMWAIKSSYKTWYRSISACFFHLLNKRHFCVSSCVWWWRCEGPCKSPKFTQSEVRILINRCSLVIQGVGSSMTSVVVSTFYHKPCIWCIWRIDECLSLYRFGMKSLVLYHQ